MDSLTHCSGKKTTSGRWYKFPNIAASVDTRCDYCATYLSARGTTLDALAAGATCNCDSHKDQSIFGLNCEGMRFEVWSKDCSYPLLNVYSDDVHTLVVYSDENEFCIVARNNNEEPRTNNLFDKLINVMAPEKKDIYFTFENAGVRQKPVYHHNKTTYEGSIAECRTASLTMVCKIYRRTRRSPDKITYYSDIASAKNDTGGCASLDELKRKYLQLLQCFEVHPDGSVRRIIINSHHMEYPTLNQRESYDTIDDFVFVREFNVQFQFMRGGVPARPKLQRQTVDANLGQWPNINFESFNFEKPRVKCHCSNVDESKNTKSCTIICEGCESEGTFGEEDRSLNISIHPSHNSWLQDAEKECMTSPAEGRLTSPAEGRLTSPAEGRIKFFTKPWSLTDPSRGRFAHDIYIINPSPVVNTPLPTNITIDHLIEIVQYFLSDVACHAIDMRETIQQMLYQTQDNMNYDELEQILKPTENAARKSGASNALIGLIKLVYDVNPSNELVAAINTFVESNVPAESIILPSSNLAALSNQIFANSEALKQASSELKKIIQKELSAVNQRVNVADFNEIITLLNSKAGSPLAPAQMRVIRRAFNGETQVPQNIFTSLGVADTANRPANEKKDDDYELFMRLKTHPNYNFDKIMTFLDANTPIKPQDSFDYVNDTEDDDYDLLDDQ